MKRWTNKRKAEEVIKIDDDTYLSVDGAGKNEINSVGDPENKIKYPEETSEDN